MSIVAKFSVMWLYFFSITSLPAGEMLSYGIMERDLASSSDKKSGKSSSYQSKYEHLDLFSKVLDIVETQYYRKVDMEKLMEGAIQGMLQSLDPHSSYLNTKSLKKVRSETAGEFGGLGIEVVSKDGIIVVLTAFEETPAFQAGIARGDKIIEIEDESIIGITLDEAVEKMRGKPGSKIRIGIIKKGKERMESLSLKREVIKIKPVKSALLQDHFAYIRLTQFQAGSADYIRKHLNKIKRQSGNTIKGIILDLRSNPGGLLGEAVRVSSIFLEKGVVVLTEARNTEKKEVRTVIPRKDKDIETPLVVLINGASASASEIVAGALKDHRRGIIMGSRSFGKGSVQTILDVAKGKGVKLTIQQYLTPKGFRIQAVGIEPDVKIAEFDSSWLSKMNKDPHYIREQDLRNHLSAAVETTEEKKSRETREKEQRKARREKIKQNTLKGKERGPETKENLPRFLDPKKDYQVYAAIQYIKSFDFYRRFGGKFGKETKGASPQKKDK